MQNQPHFITNAFLYFICCYVLSYLTACSTLPAHHVQFRQSDLNASYPLIDESVQQNSPLAQLFASQQQEHPLLTGFHVLYDPNMALATRLQLIEQATKTLDLQYYIWDNDEVGLLALEAILRAAKRGVHVRLLIDDNNTKSLEKVYRTLSTQPNIQIRLFNPYRFRHLRALDILFDFNRITRRMHNKVFLVDDSIALIGGRNMANQYYNVGQNFQFADLDVLLVGQAIRDIHQSFGEYWNHPYAYSIQELYPTLYEDLAHLTQRLEQNKQHYDQNDQFKLNTDNLNQWFNQNLNLEWVNAVVVRDSADKIDKKSPKEQHLNFQLNNILYRPEYNIDLVSAYFVPSLENMELIEQLTEQNIDVRVLTNSFAANDVPIVHAFYAKHRKALLEQGVELYEFLPVLSKKQPLFSKLKFNMFHFIPKQQPSKHNLSTKSRLHAKFMQLDEQHVFIGSFNFDPRSSYLNTEIGVVLDSPDLAQRIHQNLDKDILSYAYHVELDDQGTLMWTQQQNNKTVVFHQEPNMSWWQRWLLALLAMLPIEDQM